MGTLGLILRARHERRIEAAAPVVEAALRAGLYLDDGAIAAALSSVREEWTVR
jgi:predicted nucleic acid-binding protein